MNAAFASLVPKQAEVAGSIPAQSTTTEPSPYLQEIYNTIDGLKKQRRAESTIRSTVKRLRHLARNNCNLNNPENVLTFLANKKGKNSYIEGLAVAFLYQMLRAPDVGITQAILGAALLPGIFAITVYKTRREEE